MLLVLVGNNEMHKLILPKIPSGKYKISSNEGDYKLLEIDSVNGKWQMRSTNSIKILNSEYLKSKGNQVTITDFGDDIVSSLVVEKNTYLRIYNEEIKKMFMLFCLSEYDDNWIHLDIKDKQGITIGQNQNSIICYASDMVQPNHASITMLNGKWTIENYDEQIGTFLNTNAICDEKRVLSNGDNIFVLGMQIIFMQDSLYINQPFGQMLYNSNMLQEHQDVGQQLIQDLDDEKEIEGLYKPSDYFENSPRIEENLALEPIEIAAPPAKLEKDNMPLIVTVGSTLCMGLLSLFSFSSTLVSVMSGIQSVAESMFSILSSVIMLFAMLFIPFFSLRWQRKRDKQYEELRQKKYKEYISKKLAEIDKAKAEQKQLLNKNYAKTEECIGIIQARDKRFWKRTVNDDDFITINLGNGNIDFEIGEQREYKKEFTLEGDDNLLDAVDSLSKKINTLEDAPVTFSLQSQKIAAYVDKDEQNADKFMKNLFIQLMAYQNYRELKFVFLLDKDRLKRWEYVKMFPYVWNDEKNLRFFEDNREAMGEISSYLETEFSDRTSDEKKQDNKKKRPYYLIITDNFRKIANLKIVSMIKETKENLGFSILCVTDDVKKLPKECNTFITIDGNEGSLFLGNQAEKETKFKFDNTKLFFLENVVKTIANIPIKNDEKGKEDLPNSYSFLEMYNVGQIEQLNILDRWKNNDPTISLAAPVGINAAGDLIELNIHEKADGPHGLIAGSTGSGKSEFIITYILSLAINFHPDDVRFILIDYKGGGLAGVFNKKDSKLPHLVGTITNIDKDGLERSLLSIESEMKRRQIIFNKAREVSDGGVIDIYKYRKLYKAGVVDEPVPHLLIICDEFAELKQQQPDFMSELISISRIGRSLGVHLILATQKPSGIVDEQIRSNSKFSVCLKVQDKGDSKDVIDTTDAAFIKQSGRFYIKVGTNDYYDLGQSGWSGEVYYPSNSSKSKVDDSIKFIANNGSVIKEINEYTKKTVESKGDQLTNIIKEICDIAEKENIKTTNLWLDDIPENIYLQSMKAKYNVQRKSNDVMVTIGEYDDPANQCQGVVNLSLTRDGNVAIFGNAESGKESLISTIVFDLITSYSTNEVWTYILDFGTESLKIFNDSPQIGDVIFTKDSEKLNRFFKRLKEIVEERRKILSEFNGDYYYYLRTTKKVMPLIVVVLNGYDTFVENYPDIYDDLLLVITREGINLGINFIVSTSSANDFRFRIAQNFKQKVALSLNERDDYAQIFSNTIVKVPPQRFGRGLVNLKDQVYEMQICKVCEPEEYNIVVTKEIEKQRSLNELEAEAISILPDVVKIKDLDVIHASLDSFPIGLRKRDIKPEIFNFNSFVSIVSGKNTEDLSQYVEELMNAFSYLDNLEVLLVDGERKIKREKADLANSHEQLEKIIEEETQERTICIILGIGKYINYLDTVKTSKKEDDDDIEDEDVDEDFDDDDYDSDVDGSTKFENIMKAAENKKNITFIIVDTEQRIREHLGDDWYSENVIQDNMLWVGNGIDEQFLLETSGSRKEIDNQCGPCFGYINKKDRITLVKLLEMKEKREEDE